MSVSNSTFDPTCPYKTWYAQAGDTANFIKISAITPIYIIFGIFGRCLCLKAFYTKSKRESAYMYQIYTTVSQTFEVIGWGLFIYLLDLLAGYQKEGQHWFQSCYICMKFTATMGSSLIYLFNMMAQFFTLCMTADRLYAVWKPNSYHLADTKRNQKLAMIICVIGPILIHSYLWFSFSVAVGKNGTSVDPPLYQLVYNPSTSLIFQMFPVVSNSILSIGLILLYFSNAALLYFYRVRVVKAGKALNLSKDQKKRQERERSLFLLTVCQCVWTTLSVTGTVTFLAVAFFVPAFFQCSGALYRSLFHSFEQIVDLCDLWSMFLISKKFRQTIRQEIRCCSVSNAVEPSHTGRGQRSVPSVRRHHT